MTFTRGGWIELRTGTRTTRLVKGSGSVFSPDGRSFAYIAAGRRVDVIPVTGGRPRPVGHVTGLAVDWQPVPAKQPLCAVPPGSRGIAQTSTGLVTQYRVLAPARSSGVDDVYDDAYMGCLLSNGQPRLLEKFNANTIDGAYSVRAAAIGGNVAALVNYFDDGHYNEYSYQVATLDLATGRKLVPAAPNSAQAIICPNGSPYQCASIDSIVVAADGTYAVHTTGPDVCPPPGPYFVADCWLESIVADTISGIRTLDALNRFPSPQGWPDILTDMTLIGTTLTWEDAGSPRSASLG